jgi:hypothetical protein
MNHCGNFALAKLHHKVRGSQIIASTMRQRKTKAGASGVAAEDNWWRAEVHFHAISNRDPLKRELGV